MAILATRALNRWPGDQARKMTRDHVDTTGKTWPKGTMFAAEIRGRDNMAGEDYADISLNGHWVRFYDR